MLHDRCGHSVRTRINARQNEAVAFAQGLFLAGVADEFVSPVDEIFHVGCVGVAAVILTPGELAAEQAFIDRRHGGGAVVEIIGAEAGRAEQSPHGTGGDGCHPAAALIEPLGIAFCGNAVADEGEARGAESEKLVRVDGNVAGIHAAGGGFGRAVLQEVAGHPVILAGAGEVFDGFAEVAAQGSCSAFTGGADEDHGEARIVGHGDERGFAVAGDAFDADVFGVDGGIGLEIVEAAAGSPGPGAQCSPLIGSAGLTFVDQADDAAGEAGAVVGLRRLRIES